MSDNDREPVAWRAFDADGRGFVYSLYEVARATAGDMNWSVEPLYRSPALTDAEKKAIFLMAEVAADPRGIAVHQGYEVAATLRGLLERTETVEK